MSVFLKLQEDVKEAMKARDSEKLLALRTLTSDIKKITIDAGRREPTDEDTVAAVTKAIKQREDAATQMDAGGRPELAVEACKDVWGTQNFASPQLRNSRNGQKHQVVCQLGVSY